MNFELQSFVRKFVKLSSRGLNAKLCAESEAGKVLVSVHLELAQSSGNVPRSNTSGKKYGGQPSRQRRRERRAALRAATKETEEVTPGEESAGEQPIDNHLAEEV